MIDSLQGSLQEFGHMDTRGYGIPRGMLVARSGVGRASVLVV